MTVHQRPSDAPTLEILVAEATARLAEATERMRLATDTMAEATAEVRRLNETAAPLLERLEADASAEKRGP